MKPYFTETLPVSFQLPNWSASKLKVQRSLQEGMVLWSIETGWARQGYSRIRKGMAAVQGIVGSSTVSVYGDPVWLEGLCYGYSYLQRSSGSTMLIYNKMEEAPWRIFRPCCIYRQLLPLWLHEDSCTEHLLGLDFWNTLHFGQLRMIPRPR